MLSAGEAAMQTQIGIGAVRRACRSGNIPAHKEEGEWVIEGEKINRVGHGKYKVITTDELQRRKPKNKGSTIKCTKCIWGHKVSKEKIYCPFRGCLYE